APGDYDFDGNARISLGSVDIGAYEFDGIRSNTTTLTLTSFNPNSGIWIDVSPYDNHACVRGATPDVLTYDIGMSVKITAPEMVGSNVFNKWELDGADAGSNLTLELVMDINHTAKANYSGNCPPPPMPSNPDPPDGATEVSPDTTLSWKCETTECETDTNCTFSATRNPKSNREAQSDKDSGGPQASKLAALPLPFFDDMESGLNGWSSDGFWHQVTHPEDIYVSDEIFPRLVELPDDGRLPAANSGITCWWFGEDANGTYIGNDFNRNQQDRSGGESTSSKSGNLMTPSIDLTSVANATLSFATWWEIEGTDVDKFDMMRVHASIDGGSFKDIGTGKINPTDDVNTEAFRPYSSGGLGRTGRWVNNIFDLTPFAGHEVVIRFRFDTKDMAFNGFRGWFIDDVSVKEGTIPSPVITNVIPSVGRVGTVFSVLGLNFVNGAEVSLDS
ncbi:MAG: hypothetical protein GY869_03265, partial [Planctomycetes bacterium]|nr:hypothetical protein [Planctomycetota bacterium]